MTNEKDWILITDNLYLAQGIKMFFPRRDFFHLKFIDVQSFTKIINNHLETILMVDSQIMLSPVMDDFMRFHKMNDKLFIIWLAHQNTGNLWPSKSNIHCFISQKTSVYLFEIYLIRAFQDFYSSNFTTVFTPELTRMEKKILPYFVFGLSINVIAGLFKISNKTVYIHRYNIVNKLGFTSSSTMCALLWKNRNFIDWNRQ
jgi:Response regulator containing a CheY-like receiver domain and an HTH DNA-binding domain